MAKKWGGRLPYSYGPAKDLDVLKQITVALQANKKLKCMHLSCTIRREMPLAFERMLWSIDLRFSLRLTNIANTGKKKTLVLS